VFDGGSEGDCFFAFLDCCFVQKIVSEINLRVDYFFIFNEPMAFRIVVLSFLHPVGADPFQKIVILEIRLFPSPF
jgi:hypothetical protein